MENLNFTISNNIGLIEFTRIEALNALNSKTFVEINEVLDRIETHKELSVVLVTGKGKSFIAGADISELRNFTPEEALLFSKIGQETFLRIENCSIPVVAVINGFALGGGLELALACDFRIASEKAKFSAPEVNLGLIPGFAGTQRLSSLVGTGQAKYLIYTAERINADEALQIGLIQKIFPSDSLTEEALKLAGNIVEKGPLAIKAAKRVLNKTALSGYGEGAELESKEFSKLFENEGKVGIEAFLQKRKAVW